MASPKRQWKRLRHWNISDSLDPSDVSRLYHPEKLDSKYGRNCRNYFSLCIVFIAITTLFLVGILIGFYVRESQKVSDTCVYNTERKDGLENEKVQSVHENIMYYLSSHSIENYRRKLEELQKNALPLGIYDNPQSADFVAGEFRKFGFDTVRIEEHSVVVTYPDSRNPNRLEFLGKNGTVSKTVTAESQKVLNEKGDNSTKQDVGLPPFAAFSPSGIAEGKLVYAGYGQYLDYLHLGSLNVSVKDAIVLIRHGKTKDSRKVQFAERYGVKGVLFFCHSEDCGETAAQFTSVADFSDDEPYYPRIPVQTVSQTVAAQILRNISKTSLPAAWLPSIRSFLAQAEDKSNSTVAASKSDIRVRLTVNTISSSVVIKNIIGTVRGGTESDRYVIVSAPRSSPVSKTTKSTTSTAVLLELARSLAYIRKTEGWSPRRGIKFCSWGGDVLSNIGVHRYILKNRENIQDSTVTSINLDLDAFSREMKVTTSPGLADLVRNVVQMVPDPKNSGSFVGDSWPDLRAENLLEDNSSITAYRDVSEGSFPFLSQLGVSSVQITTRQGLFNKELSANHKYLLSLARIVSLALSELADHQYLPVSVERYIEFLRLMIEKSKSHLEEYCSKNLTDLWLKTVKEIEGCGKSWGPVTHLGNHCQNDLQVRKINNVLQKLDSHFVKKVLHDSRSYLLSYDNDRILEFVNDAMEDFHFTKDRERLDHVISVFISSLQNLSSSLCQLTGMS